MNNYRIYVEKNGSKELLTIRDNISHVFVIMENIINSTPNRHIVVIKHNVELDQDETFIAYYGDYGRYLLEKEKILLNIERNKIKNRDPEYVNAIKLRRELLHRESAEVTRKFGTRLQDKSCLELKREIIDLSQKKAKIN